MTKIGVVGGGAWGTALAATAAQAGCDVTIWVLEDEVAESINSDHENKLFLSGIKLDPAVRATRDMADLADCAFVLMVTPAQYLRPMAAELAPHLKGGTPLVVCSKGIEKGTGALMSEVLAEAAPECTVAILSGPTFAAEVARGMPAAVTIAAESEEAARYIAEAIGHPSFRPYWTDDIVGAQVGGAIKNIIAIASGIAAGKDMGENTKALLITRGIAEMARFATHKGARRDTLMGLSGLGDLVLTCGSIQSRNMSLGKSIGEGRTLAEIMAERRTVAEGVHSAEIAHELAVKLGVDMPIVAAVYAVLHQGVDVNVAIGRLMDRPFTREQN